ncbi:MAG: hypothetical protein IPJ65_21895 [Archangiaceae bacterium]|nr:hypothetical protein [Archangiaceae bacterium]
MSAHPIGPLVFEALVKKGNQLTLDPQRLPQLRQALNGGPEALSALYSVIGMLASNPQTDGAAQSLCELLAAPPAPARKPSSGGWGAR